MKLRSLTVRIFAAAVIAMAACACSTSKKAALPASGASTGWERVRVPMTVRVEKPTSLSVGGTATMVRDTSITLSMRFLGMEVAAAQLTADSVLVVDKLHKQYFTENLEKALAKVPLTLGLLQNLLMGKRFTIADGLLPAGTTYEITGNDSIITALTICRGDTSCIEFRFTDHVSTPAGPAASRVSLRADGKKPLAASIEWNWGKARWNDDVEPRILKVTGSYTRIKNPKPGDLIK